MACAPSSRAQRMWVIAGSPVSALSELASKSASTLAIRNQCTRSVAFFASEKSPAGRSCPIHRSLFCCGREQARKDRRFQLGVQRIEDPHHPRGYRELRSPGEMRKLLNRKIVAQDRKCAICHESFSDYNEIVPDHIEPKGMGGAWRDDHPE